MGTGFGVDSLHKYVKILEKHNVHRSIIVKYGKYTPNAQKAIALLTDYKIQVFDYTELLNNVTTHSLVPKHEILSATESKKVLEGYKVTKTQLPRILLSDPVIKYYGWPRANIVKITRKSGEIYYRLIV